MTRTIKDYVEVTEYDSLDALIAQLTEIRDSLPANADSEVRIRGDAVFGRHLCIGFRRPLTPEEAAAEGRYAEPAAKLRAA